VGLIVLTFATFIMVITGVSVTTSSVRLSMRYSQ